MDIECTTGVWAPNAQYSEAHRRIIVLALVTIAIYPFGVLVFQGALLILARKGIMSGRPTPLTKATSFLHRQYKPQFFCEQGLLGLKCGDSHTHR